MRNTEINSSLDAWRDWVFVDENEGRVRCKSQSQNHMFSFICDDFFLFLLPQSPTLAMLTNNYKLCHTIHEEKIIKNNLSPLLSHGSDLDIKNIY